MKTLQECKDQVAVKHGYKNWSAIDWYQLDYVNERTEYPFMEHKLSDEAAELYAASMSRECIDELRKATLLLMRHMNAPALSEEYDQLRKESYDFLNLPFHS